MGNIFAIIRKTTKKGTCFIISAIGFVGAFLVLGEILSGFVNDDFTKGFFVLFAVCFVFVGILFLAAGLYDSGPDESAIKPPRFYTVNQDGDIILSEISTPPPPDCAESRRTGGKVDISMEIHGKEQAVEVLAALTVMHDKGDVADADYRRTVHMIRERFNL